MPEAIIDDTCEMCGEESVVKRNRKTGEMLCIHCAVALEENERLIAKIKKRESKDA